MKSGAGERVGIGAAFALTDAKKIERNMSKPNFGFTHKGQSSNRAPGISEVEATMVGNHCSGNTPYHADEE